MSRLDSLGLLLKDIYPCKLVLFFPSFADIKPPFNLQAGFDIRCIHLFNILFPASLGNYDRPTDQQTEIVVHINYNSGNQFIYRKEGVEQMSSYGYNKQFLAGDSKSSKG